MLSAGFITDADLEVAIHNDPSTDHVVWQQCAETIDEYFAPSGTFWSEPITSSGEYIVENNMSMSGEASSGIDVVSGTSSEISIGLDIDMSSSIGGALNDLDINCSCSYQSKHTTSINATPQYHLPHHAKMPLSGLDQQHDPGSRQNTTYNSSPPTNQQTKHGPVKHPSPFVEIKQPAKNKKMHAELSYPITPQLGTPYARGRTTRSTKGAKEMRREMEEQELVDTPVKSAHDNLKRKKGAETPVLPRKQPKRAVKNKKK